MPNPMMMALQQSRGNNPVQGGSPAPMPGGMPPTPPQGDPAQAEAIAKLSSAVQDIGAKLDKLVEAISGQYTGKAEGSEPVEDEEGKESGEAKTFK